MTSLGETQAWMAEMLRRRRALTDDPEAVRTAPTFAAGNERLLPVEQVEIYREQFWLRHTSSLVEDFEGLGAVAGQANWERLIERYLEAHPPLSFSLRDLGDRLPAFVEAATWLPHHELCVDMARVEWAYVEAFDAPDAEPLDPGRLAAVPEAAWETAVLKLSPALRLLRVRYPVAALRKAIRTQPGAVAIPEREPQNLVVYRGATRNLYHQVLSNGPFSLLEALAAGTPLVEACQQAMRNVPEEARDIEASLGAWFKAWAENAWIVAVSV